MIQSFSIENFKSFRKATLPLSPLTLLIGANASGKSNAIEAIQLLWWLASRRPLNEIPYDAREEELSELSLRGGPKDLGGTDGEIRLGCEVEVIEEPDLPSLTFSISLGVTETGLQITEEHLSRGTTSLYDSQEDAKASWNKKGPIGALFRELR